jgi:cytochrome P450
MTKYLDEDARRAGLRGYDLNLASFNDVVEVLRSSKFVTVMDDRSEPFRAGTMLRIEGPDHRRRRQAMGTLFRGDAQPSFQQNVVVPTIRDGFAQAYANAGSDGRPRFDLVTFLGDIFFRNAAALIGLFHVDSLAAARQLREFSLPMLTAPDFMEFRDREERMRRAIELKQEFFENYYCPALKQHEEMTRQCEKGELAAGEMPRDLLTVIAGNRDPSLVAEPDVGMREAIIDVLSAGTSTSIMTGVWVVHDLLTWTDGDPERIGLLFDDEFLAGAIHETLRLHTLVPYLWRRAEEDVTLASGVWIRQGECVLLEVGKANRDESVFGPDPDRYNPYRKVPPRTYPYGVAFGAGRHMCFGLPVILGNDGVHGSHAALIKALFAAGVSADPDDPPSKADDTLRDKWSRYPVVLQAGQAGRPGQAAGQEATG